MFPPEEIKLIVRLTKFQLENDSMRATIIGKILNVLVYRFYQQGKNLVPVLHFGLTLRHLNIFLIQPLVKQDYHKTCLITYGTHQIQ